MGQHVVQNSTIAFLKIVKPLLGEVCGLEQARQLLKAARSLVDVSVPNAGSMTVCGDIHGQYYDLLHIFELNGLPSVDNPYVFNGGSRASSRADVPSLRMSVLITLPLLIVVKH